MPEWGIDKVPKGPGKRISHLRCLNCGDMVALEYWPTHPRRCPVTRLTRREAHKLIEVIKGNATH
jgi:hypothetical protein